MCAHVSGHVCMYVCMHVFVRRCVDVEKALHENLQKCASSLPVVLSKLFRTNSWN